MGEAEKKLNKSQPRRDDINRLVEELKTTIDISNISWVRGMGTTHLRSCLQCLKALVGDHPQIKSILEGDFSCYFAYLKILFDSFF